MLTLRALAEYFADGQPDSTRARAAAKRFAAAFAGCSLQLPTIGEIAALDRADAVLRDPSTGNIKRLAIIHGMNTRQVGAELQRFGLPKIDQLRKRKEAGETIAEISHWPALPVNPPTGKKYKNTSLSRDQLVEKLRKMLSVNPYTTRREAREGLSVCGKTLAAIARHAQINFQYGSPRYGAATLAKIDQAITANPGASDREIGRMLEVGRGTVGLRRRIIVKSYPV